MSRDKRIRRILKEVNNFLIFFLLVGFIVSCCTMLFVEVMSKTMGLELTSENIAAAAKITLLNVILLTLLLTLCDLIRRKLTVERPVKIILNAGRRMTGGDFTVRIDTKSMSALDDGFEEIAECFNKMAEELSHTETLRTDFVANVSHELKTPLAVMQNYASLLASPDLEEEKRIEYASGISDASRRLAALITNILRLNKLENQQIAPSFEEYDLSEQLCECLLGFEDAWEKKGLDIETDIESDVIIRSDAEMMSLVWNNLFSNAIKFTERGGSVSLSLKVEGEYAVVTVRDTGCGVSREVGERMFDKFYQGDSSRATQGNGLGLALVKRVIDITESDISVESEVGKGTAFTVRTKRSGYGLQEAR
jgi:signal transduction histidine kinase